MATNFPTSLDTLTNPTSSDSLSSPSHSAQHANVNDAVEALQAKVGADSSAVATSLDYKVAQLEAIGDVIAFTPTWASGFTAGNATQDWYYVQIGDLVIVDGKTVLGSTSAVSATPVMTLPVTRHSYSGQTHRLGFGSLGDLGTATYQCAIISNSTTNAIFFAQNASVTYLKEAPINAGLPFTWTTGDFIGGTMIYKAA